MAVIRGALPTDNYTMVSNDWARDPDLSCKAKGLLLAISSHKQGYRLTVQQLIAQNKDGRDSIYAGLRELVDAGYMVVLQNRKDGGQMAEVDYVLTGKLGRDDEVEQPAGEEQPRSKRRRRRSEPFTENPDTAVGGEPAPPYAEKPYTAEPDTGSPFTDDPTHRRSLPKKTNPQKTNVTSRDVAAVDDSKEQRAAGVVSPPGGASEPSEQEHAEECLTPIDDEEVERTLLHLPDRLRPSLGEALRLRGLIVQRMQRGWTREAIVGTVERRLRSGGTLENPCGLFAKILVPLHEPPPGAHVEGPHQRLVLAKPWCGHCDETTRRPMDQSGFPDLTQPKCTECQQLDFAQHMERGAS